MLRIWEFFVLPMYGIMYCKVESCMCAFVYAVCELACCRPSLRLFQESALYSVSEALFWFFCNLYLQSFNYCLVSYCPVLHFRTGHCSLEGHILCETGDRRISKYIKSQCKRICCQLRLYVYKVYIMNIYVLNKKTELAWLGHVYELLSSMTSSTQCIKFKLGASNCGQ